MPPSNPPSSAGLTREMVAEGYAVARHLRERQAAYDAHDHRQTVNVLGECEPCDRLSDARMSAGYWVARSPGRLAALLDAAAQVERNNGDVQGVVLPEVQANPAVEATGGVHAGEAVQVPGAAADAAPDNHPHECVSALLDAAEALAGQDTQVALCVTCGQETCAPDCKLLDAASVPSVEEIARELSPCERPSKSPNWHRCNEVVGCQRGEASRCLPCRLADRITEYLTTQAAEHQRALAELEGRYHVVRMEREALGREVEKQRIQYEQSIENYDAATKRFDEARERLAARCATAEADLIRLREERDAAVKERDEARQVAKFNAEEVIHQAEEVTRRRKELLEAERHAFDTALVVEAEGERADTAEARVREVESALRAAEWSPGVPGGPLRCPTCRRPKLEGHASGCTMAHALNHYDRTAAGKGRGDE